LDFDSLMTPLANSHTMSSTDTSGDGGRPSTKDETSGEVASETDNLG